jgi:hypothetical protein
MLGENPYRILSRLHAYAKVRGPPAGHFKQIIETFEPLDTIFDEIDLLEEDPPDRGVAMRNARFRPYWIQAEEKEC